MTDLIRASGAGSVMASRREPSDSLDWFPTPPWATRALFETVLLPRLGEDLRLDQAWEPACGEGLMSAVLAEYFATVVATDVFDYSGGDPARWPTGWFRVLDFLDPSESPTPAVDWIVTNPPFKTAEHFARRALDLVHKGVALLVRTAWLEGTGRYERLFRVRPPTIIAQFAERVPMVKGRWDPDASTATAYAWVIWLKRDHPGEPVFTWIPPGQRERLTQASDRRRFAPLASAPLFEGGAA